MTPPRNGRHDRDRVVDTALLVLDRDGLADLSMRRLAAELDVQPSALYWHVQNKQELLAAVADRILERVPLPPDAPAADPEERLLSAARSIRDALLAYRDGAEVVLSTAALRLGGTRAHEVLSRALGDRPGAGVAATAVLQFVLGHTTLVQQGMHAESHGAAFFEDDPVASDTVFAAAIGMMARGFRTSADPAAAPGRDSAAPARR